MNIKEILKICLLIIFVGLASFLALIITFQLDSLLPLAFNIMIIKFTYAIALIISMIVLIISMRKYYKTKEKAFFIPCVILGLTIIGIAFLLIKNKHLDDSPIMMVAKHSEDIAGNIYMEFKKDNSYKLDYYNFLYGTRYRGTFKIQNDTIYLNEEYPIHEDPSYMIGRLFIKGDSILFQLNENGEYNESIFMRMEVLK